MVGKYVFLLLVIFSLSITAQSTFSGINSRAMGMGGSFVSYSPANPANLGFNGDILFGKPKGGEEEQDAGFRIGFNYFLSGEYVVSGDTLSSANEAYQIIQRNNNIDNFQNSFESGATQSQIQDALSLLNIISRFQKGKGNGALVDVNSHLDFFFGNIGFYINVWGHAAVEPFLSYDNLALSSLNQFNTNADEIWGSTAPGRTLNTNQQALANSLATNPNINNAQAQEIVYQASIAGIDTEDPAFQDLLTNAMNATTNNLTTIDQNDSGVIARTLLLTEFNFSYGQAFMEIVSFGINLKIVHARLYENQYTLRTLQSGEDIYDDLIKNIDEKDDTAQTFNMDLGIAVRPPLPIGNLSVGLYAKNLVPTTYDFPSGEKVHIKTQYRIGAMYSLFDFISFAMDVDLNKISYDTLQGYKAQTIGGGIEVTPLPKISPVGLALRIGAFKNMASDLEPVMTMGLGLRFWKITLDFGGKVSWFEKVTIESDPNDVDVYENVAFSLNLGFVTEF